MILYVQRYQWVHFTYNKDADVNEMQKKHCRSARVVNFERSSRSTLRKGIAFLRIIPNAGRRFRIPSEGVSNCVVAVQHERGPRHSTLRRHISLCLKNSPTPSHHQHLGPAVPSLSAAAAVALAACTPPPPPSLYRSPLLPIRPMTFTTTTTSSSSPSSTSIFNFLNSHLSPARNDPLPYALSDVSFC